VEGTDMLPRYSKSIKKRYFGMQWVAKQEGSPFELSFEGSYHYFLKDGYPRLCAYCGRAPDFGKVWGLDRIDSSLGHIPGNLVPCCSSHYESQQLSCQASKSNFSLLAWMERSMSRANGGIVPFRVVERRLERIYTLAKELASIEAEKENPNG
jgi:hypothetical protein